MYTIFRVYQDYSSIAETAPTVISALEASAIYLRDPDCICVKIWRKVSGTIILDYWKE